MVMGPFLRALGHRGMLRAMRLKWNTAILSLVAVSMLAAAPAKSAQDKKDDLSKLPEYHGPKKRLAVMPMDVPAEAWTAWSSYYQGANNVNSAEEVGQKMTAMLTTALLSTGRFRILERQNIGDVKDEIKTGEELGNAQTAVKKGSVLGAQILVRCSLTEFQPKSKVEWRRRQLRRRNRRRWRQPIEGRRRR